MTSSNGNIFCVIGPLCGELTGHWWIPFTKALMILICVWINGWTKHRDAGDLRRHRAHYDVTVMWPHHLTNLPYSVRHMTNVTWMCYLSGWKTTLLALAFELSGRLYAEFSSNVFKHAWVMSYKHRLALVAAWIANDIHYKVWLGIVYPLQNFNGAIVEVTEWISSFVSKSKIEEKS